MIRRTIQAIAIVAVSTVAAAGLVNVSPANAGTPIRARATKTQDASAAGLSDKTYPCEKLGPKHCNSVKPDAYPVFPDGCAQFILITRSGNVFTGEDDVYCTSNIQSATSEITINRSRYYGWQTMADKTENVTNTQNFDMKITYNCAGTGTHNFATFGYSWIELSGKWYEQSGSDEIKNQSC